MIESAHVFGRWDHLVGVCTRPDFSTAESHEPKTEGKRYAKGVGVLMLTPGMLHHVGPFRLHVKMARQLSENGFYSLRFCLSGIGESLGVGAQGSSTERAADEVRQAMDWMFATHGIKRFVLFGLCSGADDSVYAALDDPRVVGLALMDGCGFRTTGYAIRKWLVHQPRKVVQRLLSIPRGGRLFHSASEATASTLPVADDIREFPGREKAQAEFQSLVDRGVRLLFLYTGGVSSYYNGQQQFYEMFPKLNDRGRIQCRYFPKLDHVARLAEDRKLVVNEVSGWVNQWREPLLAPSADSNTDAKESLGCETLVLTANEP